MANYDLSSPAAIAAAAQEVEKERLRLHDVGVKTGNYNTRKTAYLDAYGQALKDCAKQLEPMQGLLDRLARYFGDNFSDRELHEILVDNLGMSYEEVEYLGLDVGDDPAKASDVEYVTDFGNGYKIQKIFANILPDETYGDIYDLLKDAQREHPGEEILVGYCVVDAVEGMVPFGCRDLCYTAYAAREDYREHIVPGLEIKNMEVASWEDMEKKYPMAMEDMTDQQAKICIEDCYKLCEKEGFSPRCWSMFTAHKDRTGLEIEIVGRVEADKEHDWRCLPAWKARCADGTELEVAPGEVVPSFMTMNGCSWFDNLLVYDRDAAERGAGLPVDVMSPQEMADATGKAVKDGSQYYLPKDIVPSVVDIIQDAEARTAKGLPTKEDGGLEMV